MKSSLRCTTCQLELAPETERCPRCLRLTTFDHPDSPGPFTPASREPRAPEGPPVHAGIRAAVLLAAYLLYGPMLWALFDHEIWWRAHSLWVPVSFAGLALAILPLRMVFVPPDTPLTAPEATRQYALRMATVPVIALALFATQALASSLIEEPLFSIFLGLFFLLTPLLVVPSVLAARQQKRSLGDTILAGGRGLALALAVVVAVGAASLLRAASSRPAPRPLVLPAMSPELLGRSVRAVVPVSSSWARDASQRTTLHLRADGADFEQSKQELLVVVGGKLDAVRKDPQTTGTIRLWVPPRFDTPAHRDSLREEEGVLARALASTRADNGAPVRMLLGFGDLPAP
jgi:hypothetical protein